MAGRKYLLMLVILLALGRAEGQQFSYAEADSTSYALYNGGNWQNLLDYGNRTIAAGTDFPLLRLRMGYAYFNIGNYGAALNSYRQVFARDSHNQTAHLYSYWCNRNLNNDEAAAYHASYLDTASRALLHTSPVSLVEAALETGLGLNNNTYRGTGTYNRVGLSNRLGWRLQLDESVIYYAQHINYRPLYFDPYRQSDNKVDNSINQFEYYAKLNYTLADRLLLFGGYHYLNAKYREETYHNNLGLFGLRYTSSVTALQADADVGRVSAHPVSQYNGQVMLMPNGNLNLYFITRGSVLDNNHALNLVFSETAGGKISKSFWLDANLTLGKLNNYLEADGLYVYNAIDVTHFKAAATGYYAIGAHALLYLSYIYERKEDFYNLASYNQHTITGGLKWKF